jgi:hypothetical protein
VKKINYIIQNCSFWKTQFNQQNLWNIKYEFFCKKVYLNTILDQILPLICLPRHVNRRLPPSLTQLSATGRSQPSLREIGTEARATRVLERTCTLSRCQIPSWPGKIARPLKLTQWFWK